MNDEYLEHIREGLVTVKRGDVERILPRGVKVVERESGTKSGDPGKVAVESADV